MAAAAVGRPQKSWKSASRAENGLSVCGSQMVRPHSSCANERRCVVGGVRGVESWPQK